jgi:hypothetical protein
VHLVQAIPARIGNSAVTEKLVLFSLQVQAGKEALSSLIREKRPEKISFSKRKNSIKIRFFQEKSM